MKNFIVDYGLEQFGQLSVECETCSIVIVKNEDGVSVDIYSLHEADGPAASCYALKADLEPIEETCGYCQGNCPSEPDDSEYLCDGFAGDIDGLYALDS